MTTPQDLEQAIGAESADPNEQYELLMAKLAEQKKKRLIRWGVRQLILIVVIIIFWDESWMKWVLLAAIPLVIVSFGAIFYFDHKIKKKLAKTFKKV